jgi:hypothetical protein
VWLSFLIAGATLLVSAAFGIYVLMGGNYELRTVAAMGVRTIVWLIISVVAYQQVNPKYPKDAMS